MAAILLYFSHRDGMIGNVEASEFILERLFESPQKVRILRLFMQNPDMRFSVAEASQRSATASRTVRAEIKKLVSIGLVTERMALVNNGGVNGDEVEGLVTHRNKKQRTPKGPFYAVNKSFPLLVELHALVTKSFLPSRKRLRREVQKIGKIKLAVLSGLFIDRDKSRTDMFLVGDNIEKRRLHNFFSRIESELGRSVKYTTMDTTEFKYRMDMYDRFIRDVLEYPHEKLINKLNV